MARAQCLGPRPSRVKRAGALVGVLGVVLACDSGSPVPDPECLLECDYPNAFESCDNLQCEFRGCFAGYADCNEDVSDGCEIELPVDGEHCGACSIQCSDEPCENGVCGGATSLFTAEEDPFIEDLALDEDHVYWVSSAADTVNRVPKAGGAVQVLASDQIHPLRVAVAVDFVYWLSGTSDPGGEVGMDAVLSRMSKSGSEPEPLAQSAVSLYRFWSLVVDGGFIYWIGALPDSPSQILRIPEAGGALETLGSFAPREEPIGFAIRGSEVYVLSARRTADSALIHRLERHSFGSPDLEVLIDGINADHTSRLAATEQNVFFTGVHPAGFFSVNLSDQSVEPVVDGVMIWAFGLAGDIVYATNTLELLMIDVPAGSLRRIGGIGAATRFEGNIAVDSESVFFANSLGLWRFSRIQ